MRRMYRQVISGICCRLDYFQHLSSAESDTLHPTVIYLVLLIYLSKYNGPREPPDNYRKVVFDNGGCAVIVLKKRNKKKNIGLQIAWKLCSHSHTISLSLSPSLCIFPSLDVTSTYISIWRLVRMWIFVSQWNCINEFTVAFH